MAKLLLTTLLVAALVSAALLCDDRHDASVAGQCGASQEPSMARLVEDLHGETVLSRLLPSEGKVAKEVQRSASGPLITSKPAELKRSASGPLITSSPAKPAETQIKRTATAANSKEKDTHVREDSGKDGKQLALTGPETASPHSAAAGEVRIKRDATTAKNSDNIATKVEDKTAPSLPKPVPGKSSATATAGEIQRSVSASKVTHLKDKTPQAVSKDKNSNREISKPSIATQKEPQRRSASNVERTESFVGKDKKPTSLPQENSSKAGTTSSVTAPVVEMRKTADSKETPGKDKTPPTFSKGNREGTAPKAAENRIQRSDKTSSVTAPFVEMRKPSDSKETPRKEITPPTLSKGNREGTAPKAAENRIQRSDKKETRLKHDADKDKTAPSLTKGESSNTEAITSAASTKKVLPRPATNSGGKGLEVKDVTSPSLSREKTVKTSAAVVGNNKIQRGVSERISGGKETPAGGDKTQPASTNVKTAEKRSATDSSRKEDHVKVGGSTTEARKDEKKSTQAQIVVEKSQEAAGRQKRDAEESPRRIQEAGDVKDGGVKAGSDVPAKQAVSGVGAKENGTGESFPAKTDDAKPKLPQTLPSPDPGKVETSSKQGDQEGSAVAPSKEEASKGAEPSGEDEHVHFVAEADVQVTPDSGHGETPEALPLTGLEQPSAMSLKTRRHPDIDQEARQADPAGKTEAPVLQFPALPEGENFRTQELGLSEGLFLFSYLGDFLSWLQPYDFPVELVRDALWNRVTVTDLITESLQVEIGFIVCLCIGALLALMLPIIAMCHACCNVVRGSKKTSGDRNSWDSSSSGGSCRRRGLLCSLYLVLVLLAVGVAAMFATNEQVSNAVHSTPSIVHTALGDVGAFVRTTHHQLSFVTTKSLEQALSAATDDLDNADVLLGRPIQHEIAHEAGADVALEALSDVLTAVNDVSQKAVVLHEQCSETRGLALVAKERLADLRHQMDMAKRQCVGRDRALCDTLDVSGLDVVIKLETLMSDDQLAALRSLRNGNFSAAAQQARGDFQLIPREVEESTREARLGIRRELVRQRSHVQDSLVSLDSLSRDVGVRVDAARNLVLSAMQTVEDMEQWRWLVGLGACLTMLLLWVLLVAGAACGCCGSQEKARTTLIVGVCMTSVFSLVLWVMTLVTLVMGGHGEVFICRPLYASPDYSALSRLLDRPGVLFPRGGGGFFRNVVGGDGGPNRTLDVPLRQVLQECEAGIPAYNALQLRQVFDTEFATGHGRWDSLRMQLSRLNVDVASLRVLTPGLQMQLGNILTASGANVTKHRLALGGAVTARDLNTLADQLLGIASQAADLAMASRLETLAARTRRLLASHVLPLEQRKEDLVYRLTALEVSLAPLQRQTNQSLSHLKAIQYYVTHQGESIAQSAVNHYTTRILSYLQQARAHILTSVVKDVAPCRPLFEVFNAARQLLCRHIVDPLNGLWFASALSLLLLLIATPLCLKLVDAFKQNREGGLLTSNMSESPSERVDMQGNWNTPGSGEQDGW